MMSRRWMWLLGLLGAVILFPLGCSQYMHSGGASSQAPQVRVRLLQDQTQIILSASEPPVVRAGSDTQSRRLNIPKGGAVLISLAPGGWRISNVTLGTGELLIIPAAEGSVSVNAQAYRGRFRLVPTGPGKFDVVNDVDIDGYLKGVLAREMLWNWDAEAYKAQAIVARTYALYEARINGQGRHWDLYPDQRSQVYGGIAAESNKSRLAVDATAGVVAAYGPAGNEKIFKAYFSSCCGGITQSAADAFGDAYLEPLSDQKVTPPLCAASPRYNWGPVVVRKDELTRRFRLWGGRKGRAEKDMAALSTLAVQATNRFGRPTRFVATDVRGNRFSWSSEEMRWAVNTDAAEGTTLYSSFCQIINEPDQVRFVEGHGFGHGVGMCQWCTQRRAELGMRHEDIVLASFPRARLVRAY